MTREQARQAIRERWREIIPTMTSPAKQRMNGETSWICPIPGCNHGKGGDGLTINPKSGNNGALKCFACGFSGDILDLYQRTTGADYNTALSLLAQQLGLTIEADRPTAAADFAPRSKNDRTGAAGRDEQQSGNVDAPADAKSAQETGKSPTEASADYTAYFRACADRLKDPEAGRPAREYLQRRGISMGTAAAHMIGFDPTADPAGAPGTGDGDHKPHPCPRIIFPLSESYYTGRRIDGKDEYFKYSNPKGGTWEVFNRKCLAAQDAQEIFITEGAFDALALLEIGAAAIAINGANNAGKFIDRLTARRPAAAFILALDNDGAGSGAAEKLAAGLQRLNIPFIAANISGGSKDANEALTADRAGFIEAVRKARQAAAEALERWQERAQLEEQERQRRTGAGMIDAFLQTIRTRKYEPIPTGIRDIDRAIGGGFIRQQLVLLGAEPGAGKTALAQWIFEGMAERGTSCIYLNLEMSREQMLARSISRIAAQNGDSVTPTEVLQGYKWNIEQEDAILTAADAFRKKIAPRLIYNPDSVSADLDTILAYIETEADRAEAAGMPAPLVVLDYLQIVSSSKREDAAEIIKRAVSSLKDYATRHNTVVFVIIAHNREANKTGKVTMESGRDTSALEYSADLQLGLAFTFCLDRPDHKAKAKENLTPEERRNVTLKITKGRWAKPGTEVDLYFSGESMSYSQIAKEFHSDPQSRIAGFSKK